MKKTYAIINFLSVILVLVVNGLSQSQRWNNTTVGEISNKFGNLFTPASYAFSIWGLIFLMLIAYSIFQLSRAFFSKKDSVYIEQTGWWFTIANVLNASWVVAFTYDQILLSVGIMIGILVSLLKIIVNTQMQKETVSITHRVLAWWPVSIYAGWISVATIANFAAYFASIDFMGSELTQIIWAIALITIAVLIHTLMVWTRNMHAFAGVAVWALVAIFIRHKDNLESVAYYALVSAVTLTVIIGLHLMSLKKRNV
jgi:hypothetical protein